jgi:hypothetical protein
MPVAGWGQKQWIGRCYTATAHPHMAIDQFFNAKPLIRLLVDNLITFAPVIGVLTDQKVRCRQ